ncbi:MAG: ABC transporter permease [Myxococcota bacterium]
MIARLAFKNLLRNRWRTFLTAGGIMFAVAMMVWMLGFMEGFYGEMVRGATAVDSGQVLIQTEGYVDEKASYKAFEYEPALLEEIAETGGVRAATPRVRLYGLVGNEKRSQVAQIIGVDPGREAEATPVKQGIVEGRWLGEDPEEPPAPREAVLGEGLFQQLDIELGSELVVFLEASDGSLGNELLEVVGVVRTGDSGIDRAGVYVPMADAQYLGALDGRVHEIAVMTDSPSDAEAVAASLQPTLGDVPAETDVVARSWREVKPRIAQMLEMSDVSNVFLYVIIYLVAALGIFNTQRMSALERRREFGVMMAVGVTPRRLFGTIVLETVFLTGLGGIAGALLGTGLTYWMQEVGLNVAMFGGGSSISYMGVSFSGRLYSALTLDVVLQPFIIILCISLIAGLGPAIQAVRTDITSAIMGRT